MQSKQISHGIAVADVNLMKIELYVGFQLCKARLFQGHIIIIIEIINTDDIFTAFKQTQCAMHTNKPGSAGDKRFQRQLQFKLIASQHSKRNNAHQNILASKNYLPFVTMCYTKRNKKAAKNTRKLGSQVRPKKNLSRKLQEVLKQLTLAMLFGALISRVI